MVWSVLERMPRLAPMAKTLARPTAPMEAAVMILVRPLSRFGVLGLVML